MDQETLTEWAGLILGGIAFVGSWIYCVSEYGYLLGFGLGWLPSIILAGLVYAVIYYLWWLVILIGLGFAVLILKN